jgi:hypothetical protein
MQLGVAVVPEISARSLEGLPVTFMRESGDFGVRFGDLTLPSMDLPDVGLRGVSLPFTPPAFCRSGSGDGRMGRGTWLSSSEVSISGELS